VTRYRLLSLLLVLCVALAASMGCDTKPKIKDVVIEENVAVPESLVAASEEPVVPQGPLFTSLDKAAFDTMSVQDGVQLLNVLEPGEEYPGLSDLPQNKMTAIPLNQLLAGDFGTLDRNKKVIAICRTGNRSARAAEFLGQNGFEAYNLEGGLLGMAGQPPAAPDDEESAEPGAEDSGAIQQQDPAAGQTGAAPAATEETPDPEPEAAPVQ